MAIILATSSFRAQHASVFLSTVFCIFCFSVLTWSWFYIALVWPSCSHSTLPCASKHFVNSVFKGARWIQLSWPSFAQSGRMQTGSNFLHGCQLRPRWHGQGETCQHPVNFETTQRQALYNIEQGDIISHYWLIISTVIQILLTPIPLTYHFIFIILLMETTQDCDICLGNTVPQISDNLLNEKQPAPINGAVSSFILKPLN